MKKFLLASLALITALAISPAAFADSTTYNFSFNGVSHNGGAISGSGTFTTSSDPVGGGVYDVTGITGVFSDSFLSISNATITGILSGSNDYSSSNPNIISVSAGGGLTAGDYTWDNLFYPGSNAPSVYLGDLPGYPSGDYAPAGSQLDGYGVVFTLGDGDAVNLYGNGTGENPGVGVFTLSNPTTLDYTSSVDNITATPTPEPSSLLLLGTGLLGFAVILFRKNKPSSLVLHS